MSPFGAPRGEHPKVHLRPVTRAETTDNAKKASDGLLPVREFVSPLAAVTDAPYVGVPRVLTLIASTTTPAGRLRRTRGESTYSALGVSEAELSTVCGGTADSYGYGHPGGAEFPPLRQISTAPASPLYHSTAGGRPSTTTVIFVGGAFARRRIARAARRSISDEFPQSSRPVRSVAPGDDETDEDLTGTGSAGRRNRSRRPTFGFGDPETPLDDRLTPVARNWRGSSRDAARMQM